MKIPPEYKTLQEKIKPAVAEFMLAIQDIKEQDVVVTGFVFADEPAFLLHFGNVEERGERLHQLHHLLTIIAEHLCEEGEYNAHTVTPEDANRKVAEIAQKLALAVLATPSDRIPEQVTNLAMQYVAARREGK